MPHTGIIAEATANIDGTGDVQGWICQAAEDMTITAVGAYIVSRTGSPGNATSGLRFGICYVDATTGFPTTSPPTFANGTFSGAAGTAYQDFNATSGITAGQNLIATLTTSVVITRGTRFGIVMDPVSGTWTTGNLLSIRTGFNSAYPDIRFPYSVGMTGASYADNDVDLPTFLYRSSTKTFGYPYETVVSLNNSSSSTPDEYGMYFRIPTGTCGFYQVAGARIGTLPATDFDVILYDTNGTTVLASYTYDQSFGNLSAQGAIDCMFTGTTLPTLTAGSYYRLVVRPATTTAMGPLQYFTFRTDGDKTAVIGTATDIQYTERTNAGAWTENTNRLFAMQAIITGLDAGGATGGMLVHPGMTGGMRG
jgi:hypothetical protein